MVLERHKPKIQDLKAKETQTEALGIPHLVVKPDSLSAEVQTDPIIEGPDEELKRRLYEFIGGKLLKVGDSYDRGSAFFTRAA